MDIKLLPKLAPLAARHAAAYLDLAGAEAASLAGVVRSRLIATLVGSLAMVFAIALGLTWIVALAWDTPQRYRVIGGMFAVFLVAGVVALWIGLSHGVRDLAFAGVRRAWRADQVMLREAFATPTEPQTATTQMNGSQYADTNVDPEHHYTELRRVGM